MKALRWSEDVSSPRKMQMNAIFESNGDFVSSRGQQLAVLWICAWRGAETELAGVRTNGKIYCD
jgi:hypothetical protein